MRMHTDCEAVFFVSSSGHCTLKCPYCIVNPVAKMEPSLNFDDMAFLLKRFEKTVFLTFSGKGDFFAGYKKSDKFLSMLLSQNVEICLDINGVLIHEFPELPEKKLAKIRFMNLTMHYQQIKRHHLERVWAENARILIDRKGSGMLLGTIISPELKACWEESLVFYEKEIFNRTGKQLVLIRDINGDFGEGEASLLRSLENRFSSMVEYVHQEDFSEIFRGREEVLCPAGNTYFRIWNTGEVQGCPMVPELSASGNLKERKLHTRESLFRCTEPKYCDCNIIEGLGKMVYE